MPSKSNSYFFCNFANYSICSLYFQLLTVVVYLLPWTALYMVIWRYSRILSHSAVIQDLFFLVPQYESASLLEHGMVIRRLAKVLCLNENLSNRLNENRKWQQVKTDQGWLCVLFLLYQKYSKGKIINENLPVFIFEIETKGHGVIHLKPVSLVKTT